MNQRDKEPWMTDNRPMRVGGGVKGGVCGMAPLPAGWLEPPTDMAVIGLLAAEIRHLTELCHKAFSLHDLGAYACGLTEGDSQGTDADMAPSKDPVQIER